MTRISTDTATIRPATATELADMTPQGYPLRAVDASRRPAFVSAAVIGWVDGAPVLVRLGVPNPAHAPGPFVAEAFLAYSLPLAR